MSRSIKEETVSQYVGNFLKKELHRQGKTQEAFAEEVGVADRTVRRWVSGEIHSLEGLEEIAVALNISIRDIFSEWDDVPSPFLGYIILRTSAQALPYKFYTVSIC